MIASLSAGICYTPAGCPSQRFPTSGCPRARGDGCLPCGAARLPSRRSSASSDRRLPPPSLRSARQEEQRSLQKLWAPVRARATFAGVQRAAMLKSAKRTSRSSAGGSSGSRPAATPPARPRRRAHTSGHAAAQKPRKAPPPPPPPRPAAADASLGTYAVDATLVEVQRRDVTIDGASLEFCARAGDADAVAELDDRGTPLAGRIFSCSTSIPINLEGERVLELGPARGFAASRTPREKM